MYLGSWKIDDYLTFPCNTHDASTGAATDADAVVPYRVYEDETATPILTGNMALLDDANTTGFYSERIQLTAANGLEKGKTYTIYMAATVDSVVGTSSHTFQIEAEVDANVVSGTVLLADGAHGGTAGVLTLKNIVVNNNAGIGVDIDGTTGGLNVNASFGDAMTLGSDGGSGYGLNVWGEGAGHGILVNAGATGIGANIVGGETSGEGMVVESRSGNDSGMVVYGAGTGHGLYASSGIGATGDGIFAEAASTNGNGMRLAGAGTGEDLNADFIGTDGKALISTDAQTGVTIPTVTDVTNAVTPDNAADTTNILTDTGTTIPAQLDSMSGATFDTSTDSLEAIRNQGDSAWITGSGGDATEAKQNDIITDLDDIKGTGFAKDTNSLVNLSSGGVDIYEEDVTLE